jgi:hypothetical protein
MMFPRLLRYVGRQPVAFVALFFALGSGAYAATSLPANSVGTKQIRNKAVTGPKLAHSSLTLRSGRGLSGGGSVSLGGSRTLSVNPKTVQSRVTGLCPDQEAIWGIGQAGNVGCRQTGVKTIGGQVGSDGSIDTGAGFTVTRLSAGKYDVTIPYGGDTTPAISPVITVSALSDNGQNTDVAAVLATELTNSTTTFEIGTASSLGPTPTFVDSAFDFIIVDAGS